ncbi:sensor histidine kinase [Piscinibacter sakaiensis]|uniref:sensor histidine kinase n=1 Tax=Piscinibacter sakaiensis TaxID=1547922 RepID=UPI003AAFF6F2
MTVRFKIALTIFITGLITAIGVISTVAYAFQRFEDEATFERAGFFLDRLVGLYDNIFELHERQPEDFEVFLRNLVLLEPNSHLYLLDNDGKVLVSTARTPLPDGYRISLAPVKEAIEVFDARRSGRRLPMSGMPYVKGDDPQKLDAKAVIAAQPLQRNQIRPGGPVAGYLYMVCHKPPLPPGRASVFRSALVGPAIAAVAAVVALATLLAAWIVATVTRPLRELSAEAAAVTRDGLTSAEGAALPPTLAQVAQTEPPPEPAGGDEFARLRHGFHTMLATLRTQWDALRRLDHFRREGVSNLSHDLRSPLTATVACLETLEARWNHPAAQNRHDEEERRLLEVALRNTRNTAKLVRSLGELAQLDEPEFKLSAEPVDLGELVDDICLRFAERAERQNVSLSTGPADDAAPRPTASVDIELFERAVANLVDNALKFSPAGATIELRAAVDSQAGQVVVTVKDTGPGIAAADLPHLFDRFYQSRQSVAPSTGEGGKGLGLAIVRRIVELHRGELTINSEPGRGTEIGIRLPRASYG